MNLCVIRLPSPFPSHHYPPNLLLARPSSLAPPPPSPPSPLLSPPSCRLPCIPTLSAFLQARGGGERKGVGSYHCVGGVQHKDLQGSSLGTTEVGAFEGGGGVGSWEI
eukprot:183786-Hanusia_phi.AAC.1